MWLLAAVALVGIGTVASVLGAQAVARSEDQRSHLAFVASSTEIGTSLKLALQHEQDLVIPTAAYFARNPDASETEFLQWTSSVRALERYPEVLGLAELAMVPASQLGAFVARETADPTSPLTSNGTYQVTPPGIRPYYCLATVTESRAPSTTPPGLDYCTTELGAPLLRARDSGQIAYVPYGTGKDAELVLGTPVYQGGGVPSTLQSRREAFIGWTGISIVPKVILTSALVDHPSTALAFRFHSSNSTITFRAGSAPAGAQSTTIALNNEWQVQVFGAMSGSGMFANSNALTLLVGGIVVSLSLGVQLYVLGTSRFSWCGSVPTNSIIRPSMTR
jgi:hypothetical protein